VYHWTRFAIELEYTIACNESKTNTSFPRYTVDQLQTLDKGSCETFRNEVVIEMNECKALVKVDE
jgi:hypothetical protein